MNPASNPASNPQINPASNPQINPASNPASSRPRPGPFNALIDVAGLQVGHHTAIGDGYLTGTTVVLGPAEGMVAGVDVRGGGPGTHETDLLAPTASVERIHAVVITGGSAYGLAACTGVQRGLADRGIGLPVGPNPGEVVPLVPGAVLFDLGRGGRFTAFPGAEFGTAALAATESGPEPPGSHQSRSDAPGGAAQGCVGAGTGAVCCFLKGGIGTASVVLPTGITVAALVAVNAAGSPIDPLTGELLGARLLLPQDGPVPEIAGDAGRSSLATVTGQRPPGLTFGPVPAESPDPDTPTSGEPTAAPLNTTLAVVATDAQLTKTQCTKMAAVAQNGLARALNPVHTMVDGDVVFGVATGRGKVPDPGEYFQITAAAADVVTRAIVRALLAATTTSTPAGRWPSYADAAAGSP